MTARRDSRKDDGIVSCFEALDAFECSGVDQSGKSAMMMEFVAMNSGVAILAQQANITHR
jgi:hypothetical protein